MIGRQRLISSSTPWVINPEMFLVCGLSSRAGRGNIDFQQFPLPGSLLLDITVLHHEGVHNFT